MQLKEAHIGLLERKSDKYNSANAFIGQNGKSRIIYAPGHAVGTNKPMFTSERHREKRVRPTTHREIVRFANGKIEAVVFRYHEVKDIALSVPTEERKIRGRGIVVGGNVDRGDTLYAIGYHLNQPIVIEGEVSERDENGFVFSPFHIDDYFYPGMSGAALIYDPNGEYRAVGLVSHSVDEISPVRLILGAERSHKVYGIALISWGRSSD